MEEPEGARPAAGEDPSLTDSTEAMSSRAASQALLVPLEEVAAQCGGGTVETAVARLALGGHSPAVENWRGELSVPVEVAAKLVSGYQREVESQEAKRRAYDSYLQEREQRRQAAGAKAYQKASERALERARAELAASFTGFVGASPSLQDPHCAAAGEQAQREALLDFDQRHPVTPIERFKG